MVGDEGRGVGGQAREEEGERGRGREEGRKRETERNRDERETLIRMLTHFN